MEVYKQLRLFVWQFNSKKKLFTYWSWDRRGLIPSRESGGNLSVKFKRLLKLKAWDRTGKNHGLSFTKALTRLEKR